MHLTKRGEYALRALISLGNAHKLGRSVVSLPELAAAERLPVQFTEQILAQLRDAGYVEGRVGKGGGYRLAVPLERISVAEVVRLISGCFAPTSCTSECEYSRCSCPSEEHCGVRMLMLDVHSAVTGILERRTLGSVAEATLHRLCANGTSPHLRPTKKSRIANTRRPSGRNTNRLNQDL